LNVKQKTTNQLSKPNWKPFNSSKNLNTTLHFSNLTKALCSVLASPHKVTKLFALFTRNKEANFQGSQLQAPWTRITGKQKNGMDILKYNNKNNG